VAFIPLQYFLFPETKGLSLEEIDLIFLKRDQVSLQGALEAKRAEHVEVAEGHHNLEC
jgi:hypothetical protein